MLIRLKRHNRREENTKIRRNTISKSNKISEKEIQDATVIFANMLKDLSDKIKENNYQTSKIRVYLEYKNSKQTNSRFVTTLDNPTNNSTVILKEILPLYELNIKKNLIISKIGVSFENLTTSKEKRRVISYTKKLNFTNNYQV